jgi:MATE family, multidrug efflux pump
MMKSRIKRDLTNGPIAKQLFQMTIPMTAGMFSMMAFHLTDTWFVSRLGTDELAAMSFTFPVVMIVGSVAMGLGTGASSVISRYVGAGDHDKIRRLALDSLLLCVLVVAIFAIGGLLTLDPVFRILGAQGRILELIREYMVPWYACVAVIFIPMTGNNILRATGDTTSPGVIMSIAAGLNVIFDPILIFGWGGIPAFGLKGAVYATILSRLLTIFASFYVLHFRARLLDFSMPSVREIWESWSQVLKIALPTAASFMLMPITAGVITRLVAGHGEAAVAAVGAGQRIIRFTFMVPMALGSVMMPFVGQNWGAKKIERIRKGWNGGVVYSSIYGLACFLLMLPLAEPLARLFSDKPAVINVLIDYLHISMLCACFVHASAYSSFGFNAVGKPGTAWFLNVLRLIILTIPGAYLGGYYFGLNGIFWGGGLSGSISGLIAWYLFNRMLTQSELDASI